MSNKRALFKNQDYYKIRDECLKNGELFFDEYFQYDLKNVMWLRPNKIVKDPQFFVGGASRFDVKQGANSGCWLLVAMANLTMNPTLFNHVVPKEQNFTDKYAGIFRFNMWQCGTWYEVVIDDRLPTKDGPNGSRQLVYTHSREKNEFWSALLEKAYAKLYGSYNELTSGWFNEAIVDFTGGMVERIDLRPPPDNVGTILSKSLEKNSFICVFMLDDVHIKELILPNGLVKGHAYSLTRSVTVKYKGKDVLLLRLRNPWGKVEWKGAWSDASSEWDALSADDRKKFVTGLVKDEDGEFWISLDDFAANFQHCDICHLTPDLAGVSDGKTGWESHSYKGEWTKGVNAGGYFIETFYMNPQYRITLTDTDGDADDQCTVLIGLRQRNKTRKVWHKIGFTAFLLQGPEKSSKGPLSRQYLEEHFEESISSDFKTCRENVLRDTWDPGVYCIIPSTYHPHEEGQYYLRIFTESKITMEEHEASEEHPDLVTKPKPSREEVRKPDPEPILTPRGKRFLATSEKEICNYFQEVAGNSGEVGWHGLQSILEYAITKEKDAHANSSGSIFHKVSSWVVSVIDSECKHQKKFTKDQCRNMLVLMDDDDSGRMNLQEFQVLWKKLEKWETVFRCYDEGSTMQSVQLNKALKGVGFQVKNSDISRLVRKYGDNKGILTFDDFVMCCVELSREPTG